MTPNETAALSSFLSLGISRKTLEKIQQDSGGLEKAWKDQHTPEMLTGSEREAFVQRDLSLLEYYLKKCEQERIGSLTNTSDSYPFLLREIGSPPYALFYKGEASLLTSGPIVAVVGTRKMSEYGQQVLREIIPPLARSGVVIVSGLAYGVDSEAHRIAVEHGGKCIAVLGSGVDRVYPTQHRSLARDILSQDGLIISEHIPGTPPLPQFFPARNRIISGISKATIVVEAQEASGSLITAQFALEQNRDVYAVPGNIFQDNQRGTNLLISKGATPVLSSQQLLQALYLGSISEASEPVRFQSPEEQTLYEQIREARSIDELTRQCGMSPSQINQLVSMMELKGMVKALPGSRYIRA